jgi:hypothetical protein
LLLCYSLLFIQQLPPPPLLLLLLLLVCAGLMHRFRCSSSPLLLTSYGITALNKLS